MTGGEAHDVEKGRDGRRTPLSTRESLVNLSKQGGDFQLHFEAQIVNGTHFLGLQSHHLNWLSSGWSLSRVEMFLVSLL